MFKSLKRITYIVDDLEKAKSWYTHILKKEPLYVTPFSIIYQIGDNSLSLSKPAKAIAPVQGTTEVYWEVDDIEHAFAELLAGGAQSVMPVTQVLNIRVAKVTDPFGNLIGLTGDMENKENRTVEKKASETAMTVAFCRALAAKESRDEIQGGDYLAEIFLKDEAKKLLVDEKSRKWAVQNLTTSPLYGYFLARTAFLDEIFENACLENFPQIVLLGAGYDTRVFRLRDNMQATRVFELDIDTTQQNKLAALKTNHVEIPGNVVFAPINFKTENLWDVLNKAGYDPHQRTLFIWEGVSYYLLQADVEKTLQFIQQHAAAGSTLAFDFMITKVDSVNAAEPFQFWKSPVEMAELLQQYDLSVQESLDAAAMKQRYLTLSDGSTAESLIPVFNFVYAVKH